MSDNEDLLGDDLGDHSLADYNLGNEEEDQLLADDYEGGSSQNVPSAVEGFREPSAIVPAEYARHGMDYATQPVLYQQAEAECVVPNIVVEVPNVPPAHSTYAPYEPRHYEAEHSVPPAMPAAPMESPQIVPSEIVGSIPNELSRQRFVCERPAGAQRAPRARDIPDSLDKVVISGAAGRGRTTWRNPQYSARYPHPHPYRRHHPRGNFSHRHSFPRPPPPPPQPPVELQDRPMEMLRPPFVPDRAMDLPRPPMDLPRLPMDLPRPPMDMPRPPFQGRPMDLTRPPMPPMDLLQPPMDRPRQQMDLPRPQMDLTRPPRPMEMGRPHMDLPRPHMDLQRPHMDPQRPPFQPFQRFPFREERPMFNQMRPQYERPMYYPRQPLQRFGPPMPQVTIRQNVPDKKEPEIRMLPLPGNIPGGLAGKKVLINPHFKGNFQPPVEGPLTDIDDAAERFIAEQRNALARAATRNVTRRSPQRYIENTTIEIENDLARPVRRRSDDDLLRRQEEFIHANRAGLRRRMRSPPASPRRSPDRERRPRAQDEDSEYKRRVREQESMRERILRAKEVRRRKNAEAYNKQMLDRGREEKEKEQSQQPRDAKPVENPVRPVEKPIKTVEKPSIKPAEKPNTKFAEKPSINQGKPAVKTVEVEKVAEVIPDTTKKTPEREWTPDLDLIIKSPAKDDEVNSTCEGLTPPRAPAGCSDDELDLILGDIDGILSDDDDILNLPAEKPAPKPEPSQPKVSDLRSKLPPKGPKPPRQKIIFKEITLKEDKNKAKSPARRPLVSSTEHHPEPPVVLLAVPRKQKHESSTKSRQRIIFENKDLVKPEKEEKSEKPSFSNRRVILQRKPTKETKSVFSRIEVSDPSKPNPGIFSRAVRTIERAEKASKTVETNRIVIKKEPEVEYDSSSDEERIEEESGLTAAVRNLPHGMTDTRLKTLAGDVQSLVLDKEDRAAKITFKSPAAADTFKKKFNNKMVAASRLTVTLE